MAKKVNDISLANLGKNKYIETPEKLWSIFLLYVKDVKSKPTLVHDFVGKDANDVRREKENPLTMEGFELYCFENDIINDLGDYFSNKDDNYKSYSTICRIIKLAIRNDQIRGGMVGIYNPSITQRLNNLAENVNNDLKSNGKTIHIFVPGLDPEDESEV